ncbi:MAG: alkylmercury lyase family protein [Actinomycetota bacterium]|nr:alkylmercury lyase family protein [Actinomycetota bacterium]
MDLIDDAEEILKIASQLGFSNDADTQARLPAPVQRLHRAVLRAFLDNGAPPALTWLREQASKLSPDPDEAIARLAGADLVYAGEHGVTVAYPFSGAPTAHKVHPRGGRPVWAMCALDALGVLLMTRTDGTVSSSDPDTGTPIRVERRGGQWQWQPADAVMLLAFTSASQPSAEGLCPQIDFYQDAESARAHLNAHAGLVGEPVSQVTAVELADRVYGPLLNE